MTATLRRRRRRRRRMKNKGREERILGRCARGRTLGVRRERKLSDEKEDLEDKKEMEAGSSTFYG